jgi:hypothetical protein
MSDNVTTACLVIGHSVPLCEHEPVTSQDRHRHAGQAGREKSEQNQKEKCDASGHSGKTLLLKRTEVPEFASKRVGSPRSGGVPVGGGPGSGGVPVGAGLGSSRLLSAPSRKAANIPNNPFICHTRKASNLKNAALRDFRW